MFPKRSSSSETQGQIAGARESLNRRENISQEKSKERWEEPLGTMSYQTSSKRSPPFCLLIGARKLVFFWHQSEDRTASTVWNWSGKTLSPGALLAVLFFSSCLINFFRPFRLSLAPTICPWVSEDERSFELADFFILGANHLTLGWGGAWFWKKISCKRLSEEKNCMQHKCSRKLKGKKGKISCPSDC